MGAVRQAIDWFAFFGWVGIGLLLAALLTDELLGITHVFGLNPITDDAIDGLRRGNPTLALLIGSLGLIWTLWWAVHLWNHSR